MRLATGLTIIGVSLPLGLILTADFRLARLVLVVPLYGGFLSVLEGVTSFCVFHASRGTFDFSESVGSFLGKSDSQRVVERDEWLRADRRKARLMHLEAFGGAVLVVALLVFL